jgi:hypothetical protein
MIAAPTHSGAVLIDRFANCHQSRLNSCEFLHRVARHRGVRRKLLYELEAFIFKIRSKNTYWVGSHQCCLSSKTGRPGDARAMANNDSALCQFRAASIELPQQFTHAPHRAHLNGVCRPRSLTSQIPYGFVFTAVKLAVCTPEPRQWRQLNRSPCRHGHAR